MSRSILLATVALIALAGPGGAQTAPDAETQQLIERLRPTEQQMRGIRMPGADAGTVTPDASPTLTPATPTLTPAAPDTETATPSPIPPPVQSADPSKPGAPPAAQPSMPPPAVAGGTTAPAGMAAVSITVNFATASFAITPQAAATLGSLGRALASPELRPYRFRIEGHTDAEGDAGMNMNLSRKRAEAVREFLLRNFPVAPNRLIAVGFGESQLLVPTPDGVPEARNRRVQVVNLLGN